MSNGCGESRASELAPQKQQQEGLTGPTSGETSRAEAGRTVPPARLPLRSRDRGTLPPRAPNPSSVHLGTESPVSLSGDAAGVSLGQSAKPTWLYRRPCQAPPGRGPSVPAPPLGDSEGDKAARCSLHSSLGRHLLLPRASQLAEAAGIFDGSMEPGLIRADCFLPSIGSDSPRALWLRGDRQVSGEADWGDDLLWLGW